MLHLGRSNATNAILGLHGYTQSAEDFRMQLSKVFENVFLKTYDMMIYIPKQKWYDYTDATHNYEKDSLHNTRNLLHNMLDELRKQHKQIIMLGYSQGASLALDVLQTYVEYIPTISVSGFLLNQKFVYPGETYKYRRSFYMLHGKNDSVVNLDIALQSYDNYIEAYLIFNGNHWNFWNIPKVQEFLKHIMVVNLPIPATARKSANQNFTI